MKTMSTQSGFTLIELMVSLVLGLLVIAGVSAVFLSGSRNYREDESVAQMHDSTRFALAEMTNDIEMAGHWSEMFTPPSDIDATLGGPIDFSTAKPAAGDCGRADLAWAYDTSPAVEVIDNVTVDTATKAFTCLSSDDITPGTDIVSIKRVSGSPVILTASEVGQVFLKTNNVSGILFKHDPAMPPDTSGVLGTTQDWPYEISIYFIRPYFNTIKDNIPSLCRKVLSGTTIKTDEGCLPGIENMQVEAGIDTGTDGVANYYKSALAADGSEYRGIVSFRVTLLSRTSRPLRQYSNPKTYTFANLPEPLVPADNYPRELTSFTAILRNPASLRQFTR